MLVKIFELELTLLILVWVPDSSFSDVFFYLSTNRGNLR